ncbi:MAG: YibE/F family protein [Acidimicrobiales bacterium]|nr:YibE/F family protein [Acidimicrobiales bacterium]
MGSHHHGAGDDFLDLPDRTRHVLYGVAAAVALLTVVAMAVLWPSGEGVDRLVPLGFASDFVDAEVAVLEVVACPGAPDPTATGPLTCADVTFVVREGPDAGREIAVEVFDVSATDLRQGDAVVLSYDPSAAEGFRYQFADRQRQPVLFWLGALFAGAVVVLGRLKGLAALAGLAGSLAVLVAFTLPAIIDGSNPVAVAIVSASAIAFLAIYLSNGVNPRSTVALLGTLSALALTWLLAVVFVELAQFSGLASEEASYLRVTGGEIDLQGLVLAGIVIGALGALDDMTVTQASTVWELHRANPHQSRRRLYRAGLVVGRDHVASTVNTLVLAYAGASLPLLVLFVIADQSLGDIANGELVATEIVRTLVGSIGLVASVPLTTWLAARTTRVEAGPSDRPGPGRGDHPRGPDDEGTTESSTSS